MGFAALALFLSTFALSAQPPETDPLKKSEPAKNETPKDAKDKDTKPFAVKLPDGTYLWLGPTDGVTLTPQEFQKLLDRADALKKELAARKPTAPSGCAIRGQVQKRGEQLVAVLKFTYSFRTTQANAAVALGGKKAFLVGAALDGAKLPVLDTAEDGFAVMVETAGDHSLVLDVEAPVTARGTKAEVGFDFGLPRAPITTLALAPPPGDVKRVTVVTKTPDPSQPTKAPETRRLTGLDVKQLAGATDAGLPLGPVDSLEVTWDPPAAVAQPADQVQSAEIDLAAVLTDGFVESTAKVKFRGPAREWKLIAPSNAEVSVDRGAPSDVGPTQQPIVSKPTDPEKVVWKVAFPVGSSASDWTVTAVVRQPRPKDGAKSAPVAVGPFAVLDVMRQTGTVKVTAGPHTRFAFKHGPDLRRVEPSGPDDDTNSVAQFRLATGPTGANPVNAPLFTVESWPVEGAVRVKPTYKLKLTEAGWHITAEFAVKPIRTEVTALAIDVPAEWRGLESASESELVENVSPGKTEGAWVVKLASAWKQPFTVVLVATVPIAPAGAREMEIALPRLPKAIERDTTVNVTVPDGLELRGTFRGWDGDAPASWGTPLVAVPGLDGKPPKAVAAVTGKGEHGIARVKLNWQPYRPEVTAEVRADVTVGERQVNVVQTFKLRSPDGFPRSVRFRGPTDTLGFEAKTKGFEPAGPGAWSFAPAVDAKESPPITIEFALPLPTNVDGPHALPVGLVWPADATRTDAHVRVWVHSVSGRTVTASAPGWRELPPEPVPARDSLPALTLTTTAEHPLVLEVRSASPEAAVAVWVERALFEAGVTEDGTTGYRARFRIERTLTPALDVLLPDGATNATARVDGTTVGLVTVGDGDGSKKFRVALPKGATGRAFVLEVQYALPGSRAAFADMTYAPPRIASAAYVGGARWLVTEPSDSAPLALSGGRADMQWRPRAVTYAPSAAGRGAVDRWFTTGTEPGSGDTSNGTTEGELVAVRQTAPESVRVVRVPWLVLVTGCSLFVAFALFALSWLPTTASGVMVALLGGAFGVGVVLYPQPASQVVAAGQPGVALGLLALAVQTVIRWQARRKLTHLPGFSRTPPEPSAPSAPSGTPAGMPAGAPSSRPRAGSTGSASAPAPSGS